MILPEGTPRRLGGLERSEAAGLSALRGRNVPAGWNSRALWLLLAGGGVWAAGVWHRAGARSQATAGLAPTAGSAPGDHLTAWPAGLAVKLFTPKFAESWVSPQPVLPERLIQGVVL